MLANSPHSGDRRMAEIRTLPLFEPMSLVFFGEEDGPRSIASSAPGIATTR